MREGLIDSLISPSTVRKSVAGLMKKWVAIIHTVLTCVSVPVRSHLTPLNLTRFECIPQVQRFGDIHISLFTI